jgi:hypothetical protein
LSWRTARSLINYKPDRGSAKDPRLLRQPRRRFGRGHVLENVVERVHGIHQYRPRRLARSATNSTKREFARTGLGHDAPGGAQRLRELVKLFTRSWRRRALTSQRPAHVSCCRLRALSNRRSRARQTAISVDSSGSQGSVHELAVHREDRRVPGRDGADAHTDAPGRFAVFEVAVRHRASPTQRASGSQSITSCSRTRARTSTRRHGIQRSAGHHRRYVRAAR